MKQNFDIFPETIIKETLTEIKKNGLKSEKLLFLILFLLTLLLSGHRHNIKTFS